MSGELFVFLFVLGCFLLSLYWNKVSKMLKRSPSTASSPTPATASLAAGGASTPPPHAIKPWYVQYSLSILILVVGAGFAIWGFTAQIRPADVGGWGSRYVFPLAVVWFTLTIVIWLNEAKLGDHISFVLQSALLAVMVTIIFIFPIWTWIDTSSAAPKAAIASQCLPYSSKEAHRCVVTESPIILSTEERTVAGEFEFCYLKPDYAVLVTKRLGVNTFEFKSNDGAFPIRYKMVRRDALVNGGCPTVL